MGLGQMRTRGPAMAERERWLCSRWTVTAAPTPAGTRGWPVPREPPGPSAHGCCRGPSHPIHGWQPGVGRGQAGGKDSPAPQHGGRAHLQVRAGHVHAASIRRVSPPPGDRRPPEGDGCRRMATCGRPRSVQNTRPLLPRRTMPPPGRAERGHGVSAPLLRCTRRAICLGCAELRSQGASCHTREPILDLADWALRPGPRRDVATPRPPVCRPAEPGLPRPMPSILDRRPPLTASVRGAGGTAPRRQRGRERMNQVTRLAVAPASTIG